MRVRHATPRNNVPSINQMGLLTRFATGKMPAIWFHTASLTPWSILHTSTRKGCQAEHVTVLELNVPRSWLRKAGKSGLWYAKRDIPASCIVRVVPLEETAASPLGAR